MKTSCHLNLQQTHHHAHIRADAAHQQNQPRQYDTALDWTELR